jgi:hypothetical protein
MSIDHEDIESILEAKDNKWKLKNLSKVLHIF